MKTIPLRKAVAFLLALVLCVSFAPIPVSANDTGQTEASALTEESVTVETTPPETAVPTEAPKDPPATDTAATEPVDNEAETAAEEATAPALETTEDPTGSRLSL